MGAGTETNSPPEVNPEGRRWSSHKPSFVSRGTWQCRAPGRWSSVWDGRRRPPLAAYPRLPYPRVSSASGLSVRVTPRRLFGLAPAGGYPATTVTSGAVGSYPTVSPLPRFRPKPDGAVSFLWPYPSPCGAQALPGSLPFGARTFLEPLAGPATIELDQYRQYNYMSGKR